MAPSTRPAYTWIRRKNRENQLSAARKLHSYGERFLVLCSGTELLFQDRFWPSVGVSPIAELPCGLDDSLGLLLWGFGQPALELRPGFIAHTKRFTGDRSFWQYPYRTEADAFAVHQSLAGPQVKDGELQLYLGLPWASWIDRESWPRNTLTATANRLAHLREELQRHGLGLKVHSVCQHILWRKHLHQMRAAGVDCLWLSHMPKEQQQLEGVELKAWHLYPVNAREPDRRSSLRIRPPGSKPWLASFVGAHMEHYITDVRPRLQQLKEAHRFYIALKDEWHLNPIVYGEQAGALPRHRGFELAEEDHEHYNRILSDSQFTLCPAVAGSNSLRLWESLAVGGVPVILSDEIVMPDLDELSGGRWHHWNEIVLFHPENELDSLPDRLAAIGEEEIARRSAAGIALMEIVNRFTCLGVRSDRFIAAVEREEDANPSVPTVVVPVYGPADRYFWRSVKCGLYEVVVAWYLRGKVRIRFGDAGYFWWGSEGEILLMDRDLVIDLLDRKLDPPRWVGEVPYKHAFFFNQYHLRNSRNYTATYFTYHPERLEKARLLHGRKSYRDRRYASIFAGSVENHAQHFHRNRFKGWEDFIEIFSCADSLTAKQPHKYSADEYLTMVAHSRFGVSFRGNGPRCYRELEYLALGTPLIITAGVDTDYPCPLEEGVHFFRAVAKEDIGRIDRETTQEQWEKMSLACWQWFEQHGTIDRLFIELNEQISMLDLDSKRHSVVRILASRDDAANSLAAKSLKIFDPRARWIANGEKGHAELAIRPDSLVVNELPPIGKEDCYVWTIGPADHRAYCESVADSELEVHKKLLQLMGLRLRNFRVTIQNARGNIPAWDRRTDAGLVLRGPDETAVLQSDYDWSRRCASPYVDRVYAIRGPRVIRFPEITATLHYKVGGRDCWASLDDHFNDYFAAFDELIPESQVIRTCKLWRYGNPAEFVRVEIRIRQSEGALPASIDYSNLTW